MIEREHIEVKVGIFVFIGMVVLFILVFSMGDFYLWNPGYSIRAYFQFINGVEESAPVRFAGVTVGEVQEIQVIPNPAQGQAPVVLSLWMQQNVMIPEDSVVSINTLGLLGEKYVEINPGSPDARALKDGDWVRGRDPLATEAIAERAYSVALKLDQAMDHLNIVVSDPKFKDHLKETIANLSSATNSAKAILAQVESGKGTVGKLVYQETVHQNLEELTTDLKANPWKLLHKPREKKEKKK